MDIDKFFIALLQAIHERQKKTKSQWSDEQIKKIASNNLSSLIYMGVIIPIAFWFYFGIFYTTGFSFNHKGIGSFIIVGFTVPFYYFINKYTSKIDYLVDKGAFPVDPSSYRKLNFFSIIAVIFFFGTIALVVVIMRHITYG